MREAVIVSTARTGLAKSWRGALNMTHGATMGGHVVKAAIERAGIEAGEVEDVLMGCATPEGATGSNIARQIALELLGPEHVTLQAPPLPGSEDFAFMLQEKPGSYIWLGAGEQSANLHSPHFDFNDEILPIGASYWARLVEETLPAR